MPCKTKYFKSQIGAPAASCIRAIIALENPSKHCTCLREKVKIDISRKKIMEIYRYGFSGVLSTVVNLALYYVAIIIGIHYIVANVLSYIIAMIISYFLFNYFVFQEKHAQKKSHKIIKYTVVRIGSITIDSLLMYICVDIIHFAPMISKVGVSFFVIALTYILNRKCVF